MSEETATTKGEEPSMEDILSSIRKILSEEDGEVKEPSNNSPIENSVSEPAQEPAQEPITLAESASSMGAQVDQSAPSVNGDQDDGDKGESSSLNMDSIPDPIAEMLELTPDMIASDILSQPTAHASVDILSELASAILDRRDVQVKTGSKELTLESMVREMLKPILREWLDRNLPYLIERLVKKEIDLMVNRAERLDL